MFRLQDENSLSTKREFLTDIDVCFGGHVAEELMLGSDQISAGCSSDLGKATSLARQMIKNFGMYGDSAGYQFIDSQSYSMMEDEVSNKQKAIIDEKVDEILKASKERVRTLIRENASELKSLAQHCYMHDTLEFDEIKAAIEGKPNEIKTKKIRNAIEGIKLLL
jgi:ATP-dependent metalloprotease